MRRNKVLTKNAQKLRKNGTKQENKLWYQFLKNYKIPFKRQVTFFSYIVDFYCPKAKLVIELDGCQHFTEEAIAYDRERTKIIEATGCLVVRYTNVDVERKFESVCRDINKHVTQRLNRQNMRVGTEKTSSTIAMKMRGEF